MTSTPVGSTAPPLYAFFALAFSVIGWRGLVLLNTLAYLGTIAIVFFYARRYATRPATAWLAAGAFAVGGWMIEYALGVWPHGLSVLLCTAGLVLAGRVIDGGSARLAAAAGLLIACAVGVRYQNAIVLGSVGLGLLCWANARWSAVWRYGAAAVPPIALSSLINHVRLGSWNPISKGPNYLNVPALTAPGRSVFEPLVMFWSRLVDFSARPPLVGPELLGWYQYDPVTGAHLIVHAVLKKAVLQSAPWAILALAAFVVAWAPRFRMPAARRRQLRLLSLVTLAVMAAFALSGANRFDGLSFNQRYFLELLPLMSVALAWALDDVAVNAESLLVGVAIGAALVIGILILTPVEGGPDVPLWTFRQLAMLRIPLGLATLLGLAWIARRAGYGRLTILSGVLGTSLGWGFAAHVCTDVVASEFLRRDHAADARALASVLPDHAALVAYWGEADAIGPVLLEKDVVVIQPRLDDGQDAPRLIRELLAQGRRVFVREDGFDPDVLERVLAGLKVTTVEAQQIRIVELN